MTSNAGSSTGTNSVGFTKTEGDISKERAMKGLRDFLRPEFIARVDEIIVFHPLTVENYAEIAKLMLHELEAPLAEKKIALRITDDAYKAVAQKAFGGKYRRVIRSDIEDKIAELIIDHAENPLSEISIGSQDGEITVDGK